MDKLALCLRHWVSAFGMCLTPNMFADVNRRKKKGGGGEEFFRKSIRKQCLTLDRAYSKILNGQIIGIRFLHAEKPLYSVWTVQLCFDPDLFSIFQPFPASKVSSWWKGILQKGLTATCFLCRILSKHSCLNMPLVQVSGFGGIVIALFLRLRVLLSHKLIILP